MLVATKFSAEEWQAQSQRALAQRSHEERTESASETHRVENPESIQSEHNEEEERRCEEHERHQGESQNSGIQINDRSDELWQRHLSF